MKISSSHQVFLHDLTDAEFSALDSQLPNLRDLSASTATSNIRPKKLFRSARIFSVYTKDVFHVFINTLRIQTVIDLREDRLADFHGEKLTRVLLAKFFQFTNLTKYSADIKYGYRKLQNIKDADPSESRYKKVYSKVTSTGLQVYQALLSRTPLAPTPSVTSASSNQSNPEMISPEGSDSAIICNEVERLVHDIKVYLPDLPEDLARELVSSHLTFGIYDSLSSNKRNQAYVVNLFASEEARAKLVGTALRSIYFPLIVASSLADKVAGTRYAPYYFCKYVLAGSSLRDTYHEIIDTCGKNLYIALVACCTAQGPVLFHCTLGKDRTGIMAALILSVLGVSRKAIKFDYSLTEHANDRYQKFKKELTCKEIGLPEEFCSSQQEYMEDVFSHIDKTYGCVVGFLDHIGFHIGWRRHMRNKYLIDPTLTPDI